MRFYPTLCKGFTLFEVLVVLVITGLMGAVLMQGFSIVLGTRLRVNDTITNLQETILNKNIPLDPLRGLLPDYTSNPNQFSGQGRALSGQTLRPLLSPHGAPTPFKMTMDFDAGRNTTTLVYEEPGRGKVSIAQWPGANQSFKYRDIEGVWQPVWPPPATVSQTPWLILIDTGPTDAPLIAAIFGPHDRIQRLQDSPFASAPSPFKR